MLNVQEIKQNIEDKTFNKDCLIFLYTDNSFVAHQYVDAISELYRQDIQYITQDEIMQGNSLFNSSEKEFKVCCVEEFTLNFIPSSDRIFIICKKVSYSEELNEYIVQLPKLESWMLKDYVYSIATGLSNTQKDYLADICNNNIYRLQNELSKIVVFNEIEQESAFNDFVSEGIFNDLSSKSIFDLSNAIMHRNKTELKNIYLQLSNMDVEPMGLLTILYKNFRNVILIQLNKFATPQTCNMSDKQFYAVKKYTCGYYNKNELLKIFKLLTDLDRRVKEGLIPTDILIDYLIVNTVGVLA